MATIKWRLKGKWLKNCNCNPGCPCDFWAPPTHHKCEGMLGMHVDEGFYGKTSMKGVTFLAQYHWPGPLHEGNGTVLPILDERSSPPQREAVLQILSGKAGNAWFEVVASLVSRVLEPKVAKIEFKVDVKTRRAQVVVPGLLETGVESIKNLATGGGRCRSPPRRPGQDRSAGSSARARASPRPRAYNARGGSGRGAPRGRPTRGRCAGRIPDS